MITFKKAATSTLSLLALTLMSFGHLPSVYDASLQMGRTGNVDGPKGRATVTYSNKGAWSPTGEYRGDYVTAQGDTVSHGTFNGKKLWWWAKFYAKGESLTPGQFAPQGGTSPWVLINSLSAVATGKPNYVWKGWNGDMQNMTGLAAQVPTWRDGAVGAYSFTHDDIGAMPFDKSVQPGWDVAKKYPDIKQCWGVYVEKTAGTEWDLARQMILEGHEMFNHSMRHTSAADQWQWFRPGQKIPNHDPSIPEAIMGLEVVGTWGDPGAAPVYPYVGDGTRVFSSPLVSIKASHYWTQNAPSSEVPGTDLGSPVGIVIEPVITPKLGVQEITLPTGQKQYVKYTFRDSTGEGKNTGYIAATGPTWYESSQLDQFGALPQYGGKGTGYWQPAASASPRIWTWDIYASIKQDEIVSYNGAYFKALVPAPGMAPTTTPDWTGKASWATASWTASDAEAALKDTNGTYTGRCWSSSTQYVAADKGAPGFVAKIFTVAKWKDADYKDNIQDANDTINKYLYSTIVTAGEHFRKGKQSEYYGYPFDAYSEVTHDSLEQAGFVGARGGAKSGRPIPGDFFHPYRIDFDAFYITQPDYTEASTDAKFLYPENPHVLLGMNQMVDKIIEAKGYMIREFHAVADIASGAWSDAGPSEYWALNSAAVGQGGWWGGIPAYMLDAHYQYVQSKINAHEIAVYTVGEVTKYRMTANAVTAANISAAGADYELTLTTAEQIAEKYREEISVIVSLPTAVDSLGVNYKTPDANWGSSPRRRPVKMDATGTKWSVSVQPYLGTAVLVPNGVWNGQGIEVGVTAVSKPSTSVANGIAFAGMKAGQVSLRLPQGAYSARLINAQGRVVATSAINSTGGLVDAGLRTAGLSTGLYFLQVQKAGASVLQHKLMIK